MKSMKLNRDINELYNLNDYITEVIQKEDLQVNLIIEEVFANIVEYSNSEFIVVNAEFNDSILTVKFIDNGIPFNPLLKEDPELPNTVEEAQIGGLGIFLTKELADDIDYQYINGENHLKIIKKVDS